MNGRSQSSPDGWGKALALVAGGAAALAVARRLMASRYQFRDKVVLVTGGSRGLGLVIARKLVDEGARVVICARSGPELDRAERDLENRGGAVLALTCDVTDREQVESLVSDIESVWGPIDVLINNAGIIQVGPMDVMTLEDYEEAMKVHFWGPLYTTLAALPSMRQRGEGRIVNISSIGGKISVPHLLPYCASKFALVGFSEGLRAELATEGITVTTVCPGLMRTGSPRNATFKGQHRDEYAWFSISDSLPLVSLSAERAAHQVIEACRRGDAEVILGWPALLADRLHGLFPGLTADVMALANRFLPEPGGIGTQRAKGRDSRSRWSPSLLTTLTDRAAVRNNEVR